MSKELPEMIKKLRAEKQISQQKLADMLFVDRSTVASWETGRRVPDAITLSKLADCLGTDIRLLIGTSSKDSYSANVIVVDDEKIILNGSLFTLQKAMPDINIRGFVKPSSALAYANSTRVDLAFVDIELGSVSGLDLCRELLAANPGTNVVFLTAHIDYSFDAWNTGACGFLLKPLTVEKIRELLEHLRLPFAADME